MGFRVQGNDASDKPRLVPGSAHPSPTAFKPKPRWEQNTPKHLTLNPYLNLLKPTFL